MTEKGYLKRDNENESTEMSIMKKHKLTFWYPEEDVGSIHLGKTPEDCKEPVTDWSHWGLQISIQIGVKNWGNWVTRQINDLNSYYLTRQRDR